MRHSGPWLLKITEDPSRPETLDSVAAGFQYGLSVYTSFRWPLKERWLHAHCTRLQQDAARLGIMIEISPESLAQALAQIPGLHGQAVRLSVFPKINDFAGFFQTEDRAGFCVLSTRPLPPPFSKKLRLKSVIYTSDLAGIKHGSQAEAIEHKRQARANGYDDALWTTPEGYIREATTANLFLIRGQTLLTPDPQTTSCLPGITRMQVLELTSHLGLSDVETSLTLSDLHNSDGAFLSNAIQGLIPVASVNEQTLPWPEQTERLFEQLRNRVEAELTSLPSPRDRP